MPEQRPPLPPFTEETAREKAQKAQDAWNTHDPELVAGGYTVDSDWRDRHRFCKGREAIIEFLRDKWEREQDYKLMKELWCYQGNRISVRFEYEWHDDNGRSGRDRGRIGIVRVRDGRPRRPARA